MSELSNDELADLTRRQGHQIAALEEEVRRLKEWIATEIGQMTDRAAQIGVTPVRDATSARSRSDFPAPATSVLNLDTSTTERATTRRSEPDRSRGHER